MCGIVGYSGKKDCVSFLLEALRLLEYRGYDSAGIGVIDCENSNLLEIRKEAGILANLEESLQHGPLKGTLGIGHTRWATHGKPTQNNAHPHLSPDGKIAVVHNGIIENHNDLRQELLQKGMVFHSETDTEVIPLLIHNLVSEGASLKEAFLQCLQRLKGAFALVMIASATPHTIYAARRGSPLIAGIRNQEIFLSSDYHSLTRYTRDILFLEEDDVLICDHETSLLLDSNGKEKEIHLRHMEGEDLVPQIGQYQNFTQKEIHEQPSILDRILKMRFSKPGSNYPVHFEELNVSADFFKSVDRIYITGCGTAYHASYIGKYFLEEFMDLPVETILSSEFRYAKPKLSPKNLVIAVSQSGETADTLASILEAKKRGSKVLSIVNVLNSSIDRESDVTVYTHAGPEIGVASTKAFTSQVLTLLLLSMHISLIRKEFSKEDSSKLLDEISLLPEKVRHILNLDPHISSVALKYHLATSALYLGRHLNFPIALEGALKNKEISYMHAEGYAAGEMKHGPIALIDRTLPVVCICTKSRTYEKMISNVKEVEAREGIIIALATEGDQEIQEIAREIIFIPETAEELSPILNAVALQILAYHFANFKGLSIDKPRNLAKSVTVE